VILPVTEPSHAVFLSYASQDAEAAQKICETLRAAGIEVWFDQSELRGGDAWDQSIRKQIKTCALFLPVISHTTHDRREGYFRLEWKLAVDRCHLMDADMTFLLPVVIDGTRDDDERVPERFREVQWSRLPGGATSAAFVERVRRLLSGEPLQRPTGPESAGVRGSASPAMRKPALPWWQSNVVLLGAIAVVVLAFGYVVANRLVPSKRGTEVGAAPASAAQSTLASAAAFNPPPHSIAVVPFVNLSGDKDQEYFSDGLTEELLNSLSGISELQVVGRTSSFYFKGKDVDIGTVAHKLNVGAVLEGSVRRSAHTVRITAQLINAGTGYHLWSKTYDRDLGDVLKLQTEIATAVAEALKITLLGNVAAKIELGGTRNPAAFDAYLRGERQVRAVTDTQEARLPIDTFAEAIRLDPNYALAFAARSLALSYYAGYFSQQAELTDLFAQARTDAERAVALAPTLGEAHLALAQLLEITLDFTRAGTEFERALAFAQGNAPVLYGYARVAARRGKSEAALAAAQRSVALDPLNILSHRALGDVFLYARRYNEAIAAYTDAIAVDPAPPESYARRGWSYYLLGNLQMAQSSCQMRADFYQSLVCLAVTLHKMGHHSEAEALLPKLAQMGGDTFTYQFAQIHAQWRNQGKALDWLDRAVRLRDTGLTGLKTDPLMDPLRQEPRFKAVMRELRFPD
jgi:TolB-like protein/tetratricopeptide (TPR) repeat protein